MDQETGLISTMEQLLEFLQVAAGHNTLIEKLKTA
jgi:hypothetical protein